MKPRKMMDTAWDWAERAHKKRRNPVHGEEEICFVLDDEFLFRKENGESMTQTGEFELEEWFFCGGRGGLANPTLLLKSHTLIDISIDR